MRPLFIVLVFTWASVWHGSAGWAKERDPNQGYVQPDVAFYEGSNDAPPVPGADVVGGEKFLAGIQGNRIYVIARGDTCGRTFYLQGTFDIPPNRVSGTIRGTMWRCTNRELVGPPCNQKKNYQVQFTGTISVGRAPRTNYRQLMINLDYPYEKWIKEPCKKVKVDDGTDTLVLTDATPEQRSPTGKIIRDDMDEAEKLLVDTFMKSLQNRPK
jgi:hypothetical protein